MSVFSYVGDLSNSMPETRLTRFTISEASVCLGVISGYFVGSQVVIHLGDFYIFVISGACCSLAFVYGLLRIQNIIPTDENEGEKSEVKGNKINRNHLIFPIVLLEKSFGSIQRISYYPIPEKRGFQKSTDSTPMFHISCG